MTIAHVIIALITVQPAQLPGLALHAVAAVHQQHQLARQWLLNNTIHEIQQEQLLQLQIEANERLRKQRLETRKKTPQH